jgi:hypothetical protein
MHKEHYEFIIGKTKETPYWRYMDFWKFLKLINTSQIFFPNVEMLGDQHEGRIPEKIFKMMVENDEKQGVKNNDAQNYKGLTENLRKKTLIVSWNANRTESFAMWKMYAKEKLGIAIKTNFGRLKKSFEDCEEDIYIGEVRYYDDEKPSYRTGNTFYTYMTKHNYYEFETEVRCITEVAHDDDSLFKNINVDLNELIEEIYISPFANETGLVEIIEFLKQKNNLSFKISISGVNDKWI